MNRPTTNLPPLPPPPDHPAARVVERLRRDGYAGGAELSALLDLAEASLKLFRHQDATDEPALRELDRGWRGLAVGLANLAGRRHLSEA